MRSVPTPDFIRAIGHWLNEALYAPIQITHDDRPRLIVMSVEAFEAAIRAARSDK